MARPVKQALTYNCVADILLLTMTPRIFAYELVVITILCVLGIFLFPASAGPYSVVHGPASGLLSIRAAAKVRHAIALSAFTCSTLILNFSFGLMRTHQLPVLTLSSPPGEPAVLRC